ncbi:MAG: Ig-like domain-containing protein [Candidatus Bathyarchaeia archaeon]
MRLDVRVRLTIWKWAFELRQRRVARTSAIILLLVVILIVLVNVRYAYAQSLTVTPNVVTPAGSFQVSGSGFAPLSNAGAMVVFADNSGACSGSSALGVLPIFADNSGNVAVETFLASSLTLGKHCVDISFNQPSFQEADSSVTVRTAATTSTSVVCSSSTIDVGSTSSCTATVSGAFTSISGETISWSGANLYFSSSTCNLSGTSCSVTVTGTPPGSDSVSASYPGDLNNDPSQDSFALTVNPAPSVTVTVTVFATTTVLSTVPEYPVGLQVLAILMVVAYVVIRLRTSHRI